MTGATLRGFRWMAAFAAAVGASAGVAGAQSGSGSAQMVEVDYPHSDTTWPDSIEVASTLLKDLPAATRRKILRGNAERLFRFTPIEPTLR